MKLPASALIFLAAFLVRIICLYGMYSSDPLFSIPFVDSEHHFKEAMYLLSEGWQGPPAVFWKPPFYSYFLAVFFRLFGVNFLLLRLFQIALGSFNCVLIYLLGKILFDRRIGMIAGFIASAYGMLIYFDLQILVTTFTVAFTLMALKTLLESRKRNVSALWVPGLWIGLTISTRAEILVFVPLLLIWLAGERRPKPVWLKSSATLLAGIFLIILPITIRNTLVANDLVLISSNGGINFFVANNPSYDQASGMWQSFPMMWDRIKYAPDFKGITRESRKSSYYYDVAMKNIRLDPVGYVKTLGQKLFLFLNSYEISSNRDIYAFVATIPLLGLLVWKSSHFAFPFGLAAPLGLVGLILAWKDKEKRASHWLLLYFTLASAGSTLLFFNTARFRITLVPLYILYAVYGLFRVIAYKKQKRKREVIFSILLFFLFFALVNMKTAQTRDMPPPDLMHMAIKYDEEQKYQEAEALFSRILGADPDNLLAKHFLGRSLYASRQYEKALSLYQGMLYTNDLDPDWRRYIHEQLASIYRQMGKHENAIDEYKIILSLNPDLPLYHGMEFFIIHDEPFLYYRTLWSMAETYYQMKNQPAARDILLKIEKNGPALFRQKAAEMLRTLRGS